ISYINEDSVTSNANTIIEFTQNNFSALLSKFTIKTMFNKANELSICNNEEVEKGIKGKDHLESINKTLEKIPKDFRDKVSLVVNTSTYMEIAILLGKLNLSSLLNNENTIYGKIKVCDYLENGEMILGDLSQLCFNYHYIIQDSDKDIQKGLYIVRLKA
ncbi:hypothetical protein, partial [Clostridium tarantellae]|uniref:hypothetical protein n=1 Tax=Clostridium tarantellae TaxID=39493 RepID=UPI001479719F